LVFIFLPPFFCRSCGNFERENRGQIKEEKRTKKKKVINIEKRRNPFVHRLFSGVWRAFFGVVFGGWCGWFLVSLLVVFLSLFFLWCCFFVAFPSHFGINGMIFVVVFVAASLILSSFAWRSY